MQGFGTTTASIPSNPSAGDHATEPASLFGRGAYLTDADYIAALLREVEGLRKSLSAASGYMKNAAIDLATGAPKKTTLMTINGGIRLVEAALAKAKGA